MFTVFAPINDVPIPTNITQLQNILTISQYHVLSDVQVLSTDLFSGLVGKYITNRINYYSNW